jgi:predicted dehydrogenase
VTAPRPTTRRDFLKTAAATAGVGASMYFSTSTVQAYNFQSPNERPVIGCIGTGSRWGAVGPAAMAFGDVVAVCDVDANHAERGKTVSLQRQQGRVKEVAVYEDYRELLDRKDIDVVTIVTPDHWHTKPSIDAMKSGRDVYCEKPLTLTIEEGKQIRKVLDETKRVFQVGTQQRSEMGGRFLQAVAMIRDGRIGDITEVVCGIGGAPTSGPIPKVDVPEGLNWDMWLGQAPLVDFRFKPGGQWGNSRCHYEFRWWYEYSGGKMTDWGAHHVDIAQWALNAGDTGPEWVEGTAKHPCEFKDGYPVQDDMYNTATQFDVTAMFPGGVPVHIRSGGENGIMFTGTKGRFFVNRGKIVGGPVEELASKPLPDGLIREVYKGKEPGNHMRNFFDCIMTREQPISDVHSHHRSMTTCHLANIAIRLGRRIKWDAEKEQIIGDEAAQQWQSREQRKGYEITT